MPTIRRSGDPEVAEARVPRALVVDDAEGIRGYLASFLELQGFEVDSAEDGRSALALLASGANPDVVLLDVMLPGIDGIETLRRIRADHAGLPVVMLSVVGKAATIVEAMQIGAVDYLTKPVDEGELLAALERLDLTRVGPSQRSGGGDVLDPEATVWTSASLRRIRQVIEQIADTDVTVLIQGESGVGKEVVSRAVHAASTRADRNFVKVNCAALPEELLESELFGYEKGAFTGAHARKQGKFEVAHRGTIFLDEIGEMSPALQAKLLQVLQDSEFTRLGGNKEVKVDVRVVCATNRPLLEMVRTGGFREDLYFRLNVVNIEIPPLRERREEVPLLIESFTTRYAQLYGKPRPRISLRLEQALARYSFPGNVRELENMVKRIVVLESEDSILQELSRREAGDRSRRGAFDALLEEIEETAGDVPLREVGRRAALEVERGAIEAVLQQTGWNRKRAAKILGVSYKTLLQKIRDCELDQDA